jgi:hypothetical protein
MKDGNEPMTQHHQPAHYSQETDSDGRGRTPLATVRWTINSPEGFTPYEARA